MKAVLVGATGLIGSHILNQLLNDDAFSTVRILVRKTVTIKHPKLEIELVDFDQPESLSLKTGTGDALFCAIGTTKKRVQGDMVAYRKVDVDIPVNVAKSGAANGFKSFMLVSAVSANAKSGNFYLRIKGEVEERVSSLPFKAVHIFRPSVLIGERAEKRIGEAIGIGITRLFSFLLVKGWAKFRSIKASEVAGAMIKAAKSAQTGTHIYEYTEIKQAT